MVAMLPFWLVARKLQAATWFVTFEAKHRKVLAAPHRRACRQRPQIDARKKG